MLMVGVGVGRGGWKNELAWYVSRIRRFDRVCMLVNRGVCHFCVCNNNISMHECTIMFVDVEEE